MRPGLFRSCQRTVSLQACREFARHRLRNLIGSWRPIMFDCPRKALSGLRPAARPAVSFAAKRIFQSMLSGTRALDPVVLPGVIAVLLPSWFWPISLPHGRLIGHLAVVIECIGDISSSRKLQRVNWQRSLVRAARPGGLDL